MIGGEEQRQTGRHYTVGFDHDDAMTQTHEKLEKAKKQILS